MIILEAKGLTKSLSLRDRARFIDLFRYDPLYRKRRVINDVSFTLDKGEVLGIVGPNGSGKTSLLRLITGIYTPDSGEVITGARMIPLINLWTSIKSDLTMRENIFLTGSLYGMSNKNIKAKFRSIVRFSELKGYEDIALKKFSSGMKCRLVFSIAIHADPDILVIDEALEVGDESFKNKTSAYVKKKVRDGMSCILVSHSRQLLTDYCDRLIYLKDGKIVDSGDTRSILDEYLSDS